MSKAQSAALLSAAPRHSVSPSQAITTMDAIRARLNPAPDAPRLSGQQRMGYFAFGLLLGCAVLATSPLASSLV